MLCLVFLPDFQKHKFYVPPRAVFDYSIMSVDRVTVFSRSSGADPNQMYRATVEDCEELSEIMPGGSLPLDGSLMLRNETVLPDSLVKESDPIVCKHLITSTNM